MAQCPCGSEAEFEDCCGPIIAGTPAPTAESLMRSRFAAYVRGAFDHIESTHAPETRDRFNRSAAESLANSVEWVGLEIVATTGGGPGDDAGTVEFSAQYRKGGELLAHHELSSFRREEGRWVYVDGKINPRVKPRQIQKIGRNAACPCGSGKKYKKCCGT